MSSLLLSASSPAVLQLAKYIAWASQNLSNMSSNLTARLQSAFTAYCGLYARKYDDGTAQKDQAELLKWHAKAVAATTEAEIEAVEQQIQTWNSIAGNSAGSEQTTHGM